MGNPISYEDPSGHELIAGVIGAGIGATLAIINGVITGDSNSQIAVDAAAGAATRGLIGLTNGLSLLGDIALRAEASVVIEELRQLGNDVISDCPKDIGVAELFLLLPGASIVVPVET
jgi:hypothetical protein